LFQLYSLTNSQTNVQLVAGDGASSTISYRAVIEADIEVFIAYTSDTQADATAAYPVSQIPHYAVLNGPQEFSTAKIGGVSVMNSKQDVLAISDLSARTTDSNFPFIAKSSIECPVGAFLTKVQYDNNNEQLLIPSYCFDPGN
jgi:hypothetical protein